MSDAQSFETFISRVRNLCENKAQTKGYNDTGIEGRNLLFESTERFFPGHAAGEIYYKAVRYQSLRNREDMEKIAAWAYLIWKHDIDP